MKVKRNAKLIGLDISEIEEDHKRTVQLCRRVSKHIRREIVNGNIVNITKNGYVEYKDGSQLTKALFKDRVGHLFDEDACNESLKRDAVLYVLERYAGYFKRNGDSRGLNIKSPISIKGKSFYFKDNFVKIDKDNKVLNIKTMFTDRGESRKVPYKHALKEDKLLKEKFGGNLVMRQKTFIVAIDFDKEASYKPEVLIGTDFNKDQKSWIVFSDGARTTPNDKIKSLMEEIRVLNTELDKDKKISIDKRVLRSKQRRPIRLKWKRAHRKLEAEISKICSGIVDKVMDSKGLLCIDSVTTGQKNGTFGQDHLIKTLQTMCENRGVPFYVVPCKNTSRRCSSCGYIAKGNRVNTDEFHCEDCGHKCDAQDNGAINVAFQGNRLYNAGVPYGNWARRAVDTLVTEYSQQESSVDTSEAS
tara:strand:- start:8 stop:1255 length:1248 start_codon:yes stop_codon:yes gene_type:complete